jgi:hypothetical protein
MDTPGLLSSQGVKADQVNIQKIVSHIKTVGWLNLNLLVLNETNPRLSNPLREAITLYINCFGCEAIFNLAILYTHSHGQKTTTQLRNHSDAIAKYVAETAGVANFNNIPFFCVENDPENPLFQESGRSEKIKTSNAQNIDDLLRFACNSKGFSTENAVVRSYSYLEEIEETKKQLEQEIEKNKVVETFERESEPEETFTGVTEPIKTTETKKYKRPRKFLGFKLPFTKTVREVTEVIKGWRAQFEVTRKVQTCQKLGSGQINCGEWRVKGEKKLKWRQIE